MKGIKGTFPSRHFFGGEQISREMELCYAHQLLLDFGKECPYNGIQLTDKTGGEKIVYDFLCVK
jgi:hypothetical protein